MRRRSPAGCWLALAASLLAACQSASVTSASNPPGESTGGPATDFCGPAQQQRILNTKPETYRGLLHSLAAGDTLLLAPGESSRLSIAGLHGMPGRCIVITGSAGARRATIAGESGHRTVEIVDSSYVVISDLVIDSRGIPGADGVKAPAAGHTAP